jgi:hypothetical protein
MEEIRYRFAQFILEDGSCITLDMHQVVAIVEKTVYVLGGFSFQFREKEAMELVLYLLDRDKNFDKWDI